MGTVVGDKVGEVVGSLYACQLMRISLDQMYLGLIDAMTDTSTVFGPYLVGKWVGAWVGSLVGRVVGTFVGLRGEEKRCIS